MNEKPILFNGEMVRAVLDGRKTQTRRVINFKKIAKQSGVRAGKLVYSKTFKSWAVEGGETNLALVDCPYGKIGDRLWVRENWKPYSWDEDGMVAPTYQADMSNGESRLLYPDDEGVLTERKYENWWIKLGDELDKAGGVLGDDGIYQNASKHLKWRPSIFMPRSMSRITLEVKSVRLERVQEIDEDDAKAEGVWCNNETYQGVGDLATDRFERLWDSINTKRGFGWDVNPWVWVVEFERIESEVADGMG